MLSTALQQTIRDLLLQHSGKEYAILGASPVSGGSINRAYRIQTDKGLFFAKVNSLSRYPGMFGAEQKGIALLSDANAVPVPRVIAIGSAGDEAVLLAEYMEAGRRGKDFFYAFGSALAKLHAVSSVHFGLDHDNYIGSLPQSNRQHRSWPEFFIEERLEAQFKPAYDAGYFEPAQLKALQGLCIRMEELFPDEPPSLLHGDLWSGNYACGPDGKAWIFDPAVYFGHREMDIAMSRLFGGFDVDFYTGYNAERPMEKDWEKRVDLCNLYPLLVHVNLFGSGYVSQVNSILRQFR